MVVIRLSRGGSKKRPFYHIVAADRRRSRDGKYLERLGFYNPVAKGEEIRLQMDHERVKYWVSQGAQPSTTVHHLILDGINPEKAAKKADAKIKKVEAKRQAATAKIKAELDAKAAAEKAEADAKAAEEKAASEAKAAEAKAAASEEKPAEDTDKKD